MGKFLVNTLINLLLDISVAIGMQHYLVDAEVPQIKIIERVNVRTAWVQLVNDGTSRRQIEVYPENNQPTVHYTFAGLVAGDRLVLDPANAIDLRVISKEKSEVPTLADPKEAMGVPMESWVPFVGFRPVSQEKWFGLIKASDVSRLKQDDEHQDLSADELLNHEGGKGLTLVYVLCPKDRNTAATLRIKHDGEWVRDEDGEVVEFKVLARSRRVQKRSEEQNNRVVPNNDTPQGVYGLWGTMLSTELGFGGVPRIDLDMFAPPLNGYPYEIFSYVLQEIIPESAWQDGWVNELPLAFAMGRSAMRVHNNPKAAASLVNYLEPETGLWFRPTAGCVNMGDNMEKLLKILIALKVLDGKYDKQMVNHVSGIPTSWNVATAVGRAFVIVKDVE